MEEIKNYQKQLDTILKQIAEKKTTHKKTLLLHVCCAPCSSYIIEYLSPYFEITLYYYNPNIYPKEEHDRRLFELETFLPKISPKLQNKINIIKEEFAPEDFDNAICVENNPELKNEKERGNRCRICYELRMKKAYNYADKNNFDWFTTSLSISPFKDAKKINEIGIALEQTGKTKFLTSDFKKKNGFKRSLEMSEEFDLYRQHYCGCKYSIKSI